MHTGFGTFRLNTTLEALHESIVALVALKFCPDVPAIINFVPSNTIRDDPLFEHNNSLALISSLLHVQDKLACSIQLMHDVLQIFDFARSNLRRKLRIEFFAVLLFVIKHDQTLQLDAFRDR